MNGVPTEQEIDALQSEGFITGVEADALRQVYWGLDSYRFDASGYIRSKLGWDPWGGTPEHPGQQEVIDAYELALRQLHEKDDFEHDRVSAADLKYWTPGDTIRNQLRLETGHTVGKTKLASGLVNHFFDCFTPSIIYTFAPGWKQIHDLLWKEVKVDRRGKGLPGRILDLRLEVDDNHFATGTSTSDAGGKGSERVQGQHGKYLMFVLDEAEGIADFVFDAVKSMASGGICIVLMLANPKTRSSRFHKVKALSSVVSYRISCLWHPNVLAGKEIVPGAVKRDYVREMIEEHCETVSDHVDDDHTFDLPFDLKIGEAEYPAGTIWKPNAEFLFRVLGIPPANISDKTLITAGRYEAACNRKVPLSVSARKARIGVDVARYGKDAGTVYLDHLGYVRRTHQIWQLDSNDYYHKVKDLALSLPDDVHDLHIRVDGGGGFGSGVIDKLKIDDDLIQRFAEFRVFEVHFNATRTAGGKYYDLATEMYAQAAESMKGLCIVSPPEALEADLTERLYDWRNAKGIDVKILESKKEFRKPDRVGRSPDDGDGFVLAVAPDFLFDTGDWSDGLADDGDDGYTEYTSEAASVNW